MNNSDISESSWESSDYKETSAAIGREYRSINISHDISPSGYTLTY